MRGRFGPGLSSPAGGAQPHAVRDARAGGGGGGAGRLAGEVATRALRAAGGWPSGPRTGVQGPHEGGVAFLGPSFGAPGTTSGVTLWE